MTEFLSTVARTFLRVFVASLVVFSTGLASAPNLNEAVSFATAAVLASAAAGLKAIQAYVPQLTVSYWLAAPYGQWADAFLRGFAASMIATMIGILNAPDLSTLHSVLVAGVVGAVSAGVRATQSALTSGDKPAPSVGFPEPSVRGRPR